MARRKKRGRRKTAGPHPPAATPSPARRDGRGAGGRRALVLALAALVVVAAATALWLFRRPGGPGESAGPAARPSPREEFLAVARRLNERSEFFGTLLVDDLQERLRKEGPDTIRGLFIRSELTQRLLELGRWDEAEEELAALQEKLDRLPGFVDKEPGFLRLAGLVHLRRAEVENCIRRHDRECCLLPLRGGGVHEVQAPAEKAREAYLGFLERDPESLRGRWLLNITSMALGGYPQDVPERWLIPESAFESEHDLGRFVDVAPELGVDRFNLCGGVIADDFDGDGRLDIVTSTIDPDEPLTWYRNTGDGFADVTAGSGLEDQLGGLNIVGGDYDGDGDVDVLVLRGAWMFEDGRIRNSLLRNEGDGTFSDVTWEAGLAEPGEPTQAATWGDFDNDGDLDLFVGVESLIWDHLRGWQTDHEGDYHAHLYENQGDGTFVDVARAAGVASVRYCKGVTAGDYDNDGDLDLFLSVIGPNQLFRNEGNGRFVEVGKEVGVEEPRGRSFAPWFFDFDNDGWLDLFVAAYDAKVDDIAADYLGRAHQASIPRLYHNEGGTFRDVTEEAGLARPFLPMGANFGDFDNDGFLDFYLTTGEPSYEVIVPNVALRNDGAGHFQDVTFSAGLGHLQKGHGVAFFDFDEDGDQDVFHQLGGFFRGDGFQNALFRNPGQGHHWLVLRLVGTSSNRMAYGARIRVTVETPGGPREIHRAVGSVSSFGGSPARQEIGLGDATAVREVEVRWPASGIVQRFEGLPMDATVVVTEGTDEPSVE